MASVLLLNPTLDLNLRANRMEMSGDCTWSVIPLWVLGRQEQDNLEMYLERWERC